MNPTMTTFTGRHVNPLDLRHEDVDIRDIAHHLACINRFCGGARVPVNVACHSYYVSQLVPREHRLQALLHDASEAYLGDVTKWLKESPAMAAYREAETHAERTIFRVFGCAEEMHPTVVEADRLMVRLEYYRSYPEGCFIPHPKYGPLTEEEQVNLSILWHPSDWQLSEQIFLGAFMRYWKERTEFNEDRQ